MEKEPFPCPEGEKWTFALKYIWEALRFTLRKSVFHPLFSSHVCIGVARLYPSNRAPELGYRGLVARPDGWTCEFLCIWAGFFIPDAFTVCPQLRFWVCWLSHVDAKHTGASYLTPCVSKRGNQPESITASSKMLMLFLKGLEIGVIRVSLVL